MALKTILVHLANDEDHQARLRTAHALALRHGAHLTGLFIARPLDLPIEVTGRGASMAYLAEAATQAEEKARLLEAEFRDSCARAKLPHDWIVAQKDHLEALARHAHAADLIVVSRGRQRYLEDRIRLRLSEELVLVTGLPILMLPVGYSGSEPGRRVVVAWKPTREAVRAIRDSLPVLQLAERVVLVTVSPTSEDALSALEAQQYLERQGIVAETVDVPEGSGGVGSNLVDVATAKQADLIVSGAYGHSRLREIVLGGVTRSLLRESPLPLLLSH